MCCSKPIFQSASVLPSQVCKLFISNHWCQLWNCVLIPSQMVSVCFNVGDATSMIYKKKISNLDLSDHRTVFYFSFFHLKWALAKRSWQYLCWMLFLRQCLPIVWRTRPFSVEFQLQLFVHKGFHRLMNQTPSLPPKDSLGSYHT